MKEIELQKMTCDIVQGRGGFARKMSNRFMVGVVDLLIKLHGEFPAGVFEVKKEDWGPIKNMYNLEVTTPQQNFLRDAAKAGMPAGVISFTDKGRSSLGMKVFRLDELKRRGFTVTLTEHVPLGHHDVRNDNVIKLLQDFFYDWVEREQ